jgi:selenocysteine lyase/cysteine desulfurase
VLAGRADWLDAATPYLVGGGATTRVDTDDTGLPAPNWATGAARHEGGSPNVIGAIALAAACATVRDRWADVIVHEQALAVRLRTGLAGIPGVRVFALFQDAGLDAVGVVPFTVDGADSSDVSLTLSYRYGIGVRDGKFCAHLLVDHLLSASPQATAVRASIGLGSTLEHIERLLEAVAEIAGEVDRARRAGTSWTPPADPQAELDAVRPW